MKRIAGALVLILATAWVADRLVPPPDGRELADSAQVLAADDGMLRLYTTSDGYWRLPIAVDGISPLYRKLLLAYEDKRFDYHPGVDPLALARAFAQWIRHGRVVSGASTLTMQTARLLDPGPRTLGRKALEIWRALQLEWRMSKEEILALYLRLAPFGGNIQGLRAASLLYFGREPGSLTPAQAALLIALPQNPEARRPDRHPETARSARDQVLERLYQNDMLTQEQYQLALQQAIPPKRRVLPTLAPQLADRLRGDGATHSLIDRDVQTRLERLAGRQQAALPKGYTLAALVVRNSDRAVIGHLGSGDYFGDRGSMLDLSRALRSPGSTLKPLIYGLAFDLKLLHPQTRILDAPYKGGDYAPVNFDGYYHGSVSATEALQRSLNVPAVKVLKAIGPRLTFDRLQAAGAELRLPKGAEPGLPLALGGAGVTLETLVGLYTALATDGRYGPLRFCPEDELTTRGLLGEAAAWYVRDILEGTPEPDGNSRDGRRFAFKTGTSYGFRDAWAIGFDSDYTIGIWVGRPDGSAGTGRNGRELAAPILFDTRRLLPQAGTQPRGIPNTVLRLSFENLPASLQRLAGDTIAGRPLEIVWPQDHSTLTLSDNGDIQLIAQGGSSPYQWLANGAPLPVAESRWLPDGPGAARLSVVDGDGSSHSVEIWVAPPPH
ncbi:MAG: penicillin-binding protein 1C [Chromatiales bacterium]|nr:penicillin-binding protein 1C [Chromatiales bacterium]